MPGIPQRSGFSAGPPRRSSEKKSPRFRRRRRTRSARFAGEFPAAKSSPDSKPCALPAPAGRSRSASRERPSMTKTARLFHSCSSLRISANGNESNSNCRSGRKSRHSWNRRCARRRKWRCWGVSRAASRTTSTICSWFSTAARLYLNQIQRTTEKAAAITKQLLAFSRKQILEMKPMDLHEALTSSEFMLPRLLGSDIELSSHHHARRSWIICDASQIEQVIANLAINSRDAMPKGGRLTIATTNASRLPEDAAASAPSATSVHDWVVLSVTDSGCGMDEKTRAQIFEPFFTTKPLGKGTGLGLATVYGIVKQSNGHIHVRTTPGEGTTFEIYFPSVDPVLPAVPASEEATAAPEPAAATILVADDESALRHAVVELLRASGYTVF